MPLIPVHAWAAVKSEECLDCHDAFKGVSLVDLSGMVVILIALAAVCVHVTLRILVRR